MKLLLLYWLSTVVFAAPTGYEEIGSLNAEIKENAGTLDFFIQDVCVDGQDNIIKGDPATCPKHRNIRIGEKVPYFISDMNTISQDRYQALFSYPVGGADGKLKSMVSKIFRSSENPLNGNFKFGFRELNDGFDLIDPAGPYPSIIRTSDGGCLDQKFSQMEGPRSGAWIIGGSSDQSGSRNHTTRIDRLSPGRKAECSALSQSNSTRTVWNASSQVSFLSNKKLPAIVTYHYAHQDLSRKNNALEKFYFTKEYGFSRWEAWIPMQRCVVDFAQDLSRCTPQDDRNILRGRCGSSDGTTTFGNQTWVRTDCRDSTFYHELTNPVLPLIESMATTNGLVDVRNAAALHAGIYGPPPVQNPNDAALIVKDVVYDTASSMNKMDIYLPKASTPGPHPALLYIHGGCYSEGDKADYSLGSDFRQQIKDLTKDGLVVVSVNYRLRSRYPAALQDVQQALRYLRKNAAKYNINPEMIVSHGQSAGGHLASLLGVREAYAKGSKKSDAYSSRVPLVVDWFGRVDFAGTKSSCAENLIGAPLAKAKSDYVDASPLSHLSSNSAEFMVVHGTHDAQVPVADSVKLANALADLGRPVEFVLVEGEKHMFDKSRGLDKAWKLTRAKILDFVGKEKRPVANIASPLSVLLNAGSSVPDSSQKYQPDAYFEGGFRHTYANDSTVGANSQGLYNKARAGSSFFYKVDREPGIYDIVLHFAEKLDSVNKAGKRVFGVSLSAWRDKKEGKKVVVFPDLDLYKLAGQNKVIKRQITYVTESGPVKVNFRAKKSNATLSAIEILENPLAD